MRAMYAAIWRVTAREQVLLIGLAAAVSVLAAAPLKLQQLVVNSLIEGGGVGLLVRLCAAFLAVVLLSAALKFALNYGMSITGERVIRMIRERLYRNQVAGIAAGDADAPGRGALLSMLSTEAEALGKFAGTAMASPLVQVGTLVSVLLFIVTAEPWLGVLALGVVLPQAVIVLAIQRRINRRVQDRVRALRDVSNRISEGGLDRIDEAILADFETIFATRRTLFVLKLSSKFAMTAISALGVAGVLFLGGLLVLQDRTDVGTVVASLSGLARIDRPWRDLIAFVRSASTVQVKYAMLAGTLARRLAGPEAPAGGTPPVRSGR